jgi:DNA (cytosine-5)-methyltransferase 1
MLRAIDLYSGIGGWTLGLKMAGIKIVKSYEWWSVANETHNNNFGTSTPEIDIRKLDLSELPEGINVVVGSPPCTQFSYANRGGSGDIADGLKDIAKFLDVVQYYKSKGTLKYWAMENIPRVSGILENEIQLGGQLEKYAHLVKENHVFNCANYGLPQRRKRMIAGDFPIKNLNNYKDQFIAPTLGQVMNSFKSDTIVDINYGIKIQKSQLTDHDQEIPLTSEERRINEAQKKYHTVYNKMNFPEDLSTTARTMTATCTRVSRESVVVNAGKDDVRRLSIRERATLQGFPITYQFYGKSYSNRIKMIGNAIPPLLTYFIASAMLGKELKEVNPRKKLKYVHSIPSIPRKPVKPEASAKKYSRSRLFRFSIRPLRFGSGVGFELRNSVTEDTTTWSVRYFHGSSKAIKEIPLKQTLLTQCIKIITEQKPDFNLEASTKSLSTLLKKINGKVLQDAWTHVVEDSESEHPFKLLDMLESISESLITQLKELDYHTIEEFVLSVHKLDSKGANGSTKKVKANAHKIFVGLILGSWVNSNAKSIS